MSEIYRLHVRSVNCLHFCPGVVKPGSGELTELLVKSSHLTLDTSLLGKDGSLLNLRFTPYVKVLSIVNNLGIMYLDPGVCN